MSYIEMLEARANELRKNRMDLRRKIAELPTGELRLVRNKGYQQFYRVKEDGSRQYIAKSDRLLAEELAVKAICRSKIEMYDRELKLIEDYLRKYRKMLNSFESRLIPKMIKFRSLIGKKRDERIESFLAQKYVLAPRQDECTFETKRGLMVRSKAESDITDKLDSYGLPFLYEKPYFFTRDGRGKTIFLDFTIMNPITHEIVGWTHMGGMDSPVYVKRNETHIADLCKFGFIPGDNLIITFEGGKHRLSSAEIEEQIVRYFPGIETWSMR